MQKYCENRRFCTKRRMMNADEKANRVFPHDEAFGLTDGPQTRMKPGFVRNQVYYSYNNFTTI